MGTRSILKSVRRFGMFISQRRRWIFYEAVIPYPSPGSILPSRFCLLQAKKIQVLRQLLQEIPLFAARILRYKTTLPCSLHEGPGLPLDLKYILVLCLSPDFQLEGS